MGVPPPQPEAAVATTNKHAKIATSTRPKGVIVARA
jgi:hypothetical protein